MLSTVINILKLDAIRQMKELFKHVALKVEVAVRHGKHKTSGKWSV